MPSSRPALGGRGRASTATPPAGAVLAAHQVETSTSGCRWGLKPVATRPGRFTEQQCILSTTSTVMVTLPSGSDQRDPERWARTSPIVSYIPEVPPCVAEGTDYGPRRH